MKNYLKEPLTEDEKKEIKGIIWMVVRNCKHKINKMKNKVELVDDLGLIYNDSYKFEYLEFGDYRDSLTPLTELDKTDIVNKLNTLMDDLTLFELKRALTFNEKLVFFFVFMEKYKLKNVQFLLSVDRKTIYNRQKSVEAKIEFFKEVF